MTESAIAGTVADRASFDAAADLTSVEFGRGRQLWSRPGWRVGVFLIGLMATCAAVPGLITSIAPGGGDAVGCSLRAVDGSYQDMLPPSSTHWFGTDAQGCDVFDRVVFGARASLLIGVGTGLLATLVGTVVGLAAGWHGGALDAFVRRVCDVVLAIPFVVGVILILSMLAGDQRGAPQIVLALVAVLWPAPARLARAATLSIKPLEYVEAARAQGAGATWILRCHVAPNVSATIAAYTTSLIGLVIGAEAVLTYLGIGLQIPAVSWGLMIDSAQTYYATQPHLLIYPGVFIALTVAGFILAGDALADTLDARRMT